MEEADMIIIGGGPGGLSAAIYAVRNGLKTIVLEKGLCGGLAGEAPWIENYLGFEGVKGMELAGKFRDHAAKYADIRESVEVLDISESEGTFGIKTSGGPFMGKALILATGSSHSKLGAKGEEELAGRGVSYCATCDGFFFRGKKVLVVGGGNTAVMDAVHLHDIGCLVTLVHRKDQLRAECALKDAMEERGIDIIWESEVTEILGEDRVTGVILRNNVNGNLERRDFDGVFVSVGETPNNNLALKIGVELDEKDYIITDRFQRTNIKRLYAVGDITGGVKQVIVAAGAGAVAAMAAFEDLVNPYWTTCKIR